MQGEAQNPLQQFYQRNQAFALPGPYQTTLNPLQELLFRLWVQQNTVPFDPAGQVQDYDMRGFWKALMAGDSRARSAVDPNDQRMHYPDYWKTPYHETFSAESQWAAPGAPSWNDKDQLVGKDGTVLFDGRAPKNGAR